MFGFLVKCKFSEKKKMEAKVILFKIFFVLQKKGICD